MHHSEHAFPMKRHGDFSIMLWACFSSVGVSEAGQRWWEMDGVKYKAVLEENVLWIWGRGGGSLSIKTLELKQLIRLIGINQY